MLINLKIVYPQNQIQANATFDGLILSFLIVLTPELKNLENYLPTPSSPPHAKAIFPRISYR